MSTILSDRCPKCGKIIAYTSEATELQCPCGHRFLVVEFVSERLKMEKAQEDSRKAQEALAAAEAEKAALQNRLNGTLTALDGILGSQKAEDAKLEGILDSLKADRQTHDAMAALLHAVRQDQQSGRDALSRLLDEVMKRQSGAAEKLTAVQELAARILNAQKSGAKAVEQMQDEILERIEAFDLKARERLSLSNDFYTWSRSMQQDDVQRLQDLQSSSDVLLQGQKDMTAKLDSLSQSIDHIQKIIDGGFDQLRKQRLDTLIALYHQATGLQIEREFEKAEDTYRKLLAMGGQDAQDAEVYWRMLLCHYGVEYQEENGKIIPIILRPDLTEPGKMQVRKDLFAYVKTEEQRAYYTERLRKIDFYLDRYRKLRMDKNWQYDVFISVKQNDNDHHTSDSDRASELYFYFKGKPELASKHLRVFNSRHTPLPKGEEYEPYIITALMSAKLLIVVGSKPEYMNSRWVRNEWQRFQYLQEQDKAKTGKTERRLFCYFVDGMRADQLPSGLNPNAQGVMDGIKAGDEILDVAEAVFPGPVDQRGPSETPEQIAEDMETWLKLRKYEQVIAKYKSIENTRPGILKTEPLLCLYTLCAQNQVRTPEALAAKGPDLRADPLYELAYEYANTDLRAWLKALWKTEAPTPKPQPASESPIPQPTPEPPTPQPMDEGALLRLIVGNMEDWLKRKEYPQVIAKYTNIRETKPELLKVEPLLYLYMLCAQNRVQTIEKLGTVGANLRANPSYKLAYENANTALRARLDALWKTGAPTPKPQPASESPAPSDPPPAPDAPQEKSYPNGKYVGQLVNGKRHGRGVMDYTNGNRYDGEWANDTRHGKGVLILADGGRYDGEWKDGTRSGKGVYSYPNGDRYEGEWRDGKRNGKGVYSSQNGDRYEGNWKNGKIVQSGQGQKKPQEPAPNHYAKYMEALTDYVRHFGNIRLTDAQIRDFITLHHLQQWKISVEDVQKDLEGVYAKLGTKKPPEPAPNHYAKYMEALTEYVRQSGNIKLTREQIQEFIALHHLQRWKISVEDVQKDLEDVYAKLGIIKRLMMTLSHSSSPDGTQWDYDRYVRSLTDYVQQHGNTRLTHAQIQEFIALHHLQQWNIKESDVQKNLEDVYAKLGIKASSTAGKQELTYHSALRFWRKYLPAVNSGALLPPNLTSDQILAAQKNLGIEMKGTEGVLGVIHVKHGFLKGNTVLIVTRDRLYINTNNKQASPPRAVPLRNIEKAEAVQDSGPRYRLNLRLKDGGFCSFSGQTTSDKHDVLNYQALARAINQFIRQFEL